MKKMKLITLFCAITALFCFTGCDNNSDVIWDMHPVSYMIQVTDANGNDLLNPEFSGNLTDQSVTATFRGEEYACRWSNREEEITTRYYMPVFEGLFHVQRFDGNYYLEFGELDGEKDYNDDLILNWGDGTQDVITLKRTVKRKKNDTKRDVKTTFYLNGSKVNVTDCYSAVKIEK